MSCWHLQVDGALAAADAILGAADAAYADVDAGGILDGGSLIGSLDSGAAGVTFWVEAF